MRITLDVLTDTSFFRHHNPLHDHAERATAAWAADLDLLRTPHAHDWFVGARITALTAARAGMCGARHMPLSSCGRGACSTAAAGRIYPARCRRRACRTTQSD